MQAKSFIEILANELRKEIRAEVEAELAASRVSPAARVESSFKADQTALWLNLRMGGALVGGVRPARTYQAGKSANGQQKSARNQQSTTIRQLPSAGEQAPSVERIGRASTIEQTVALEFFRREGAVINETFSESQLKAQFRKIAFRIHPDRHTDASVSELQSLATRFQTLVESAEILEAALS